MASRILKEMHEMAQELTDAGLMDKQTMREFDALCLPEIKEYSKEEIKLLRERHHTSQAVFAKYLNISPSTIKGWEQGDKKPSALALKLLNVVDKNGLVVLT